MSNKTRKHIWPVSLVMSIAIVGALAAFLVLAGNPGETQAHGAGDHPNQGWPACADMTDAQRAIHDGIHTNVGAHGTMDPCPDTTNGGNGGNGGNGQMGATGVSLESSSTSGSATVELKLTVTLDEDVPVGGAFVLYLEDDFQEPDSISASDVYFVSMPSKLVTGNGSRVYATVNPEIDTSDHFTADKDDIDIRVSVPDMCANNEAECEGANGLMAGDTVTMVIQKSAGIKNPSEAGTHSVGASVLGPIDSVGDPMYRTDKVYAKDSALATMAQEKNNKVILAMRPDPLPDPAHDVGLKTLAKIGLSDVDNSRGYEMTVTGSGFNNGTTAAVYVLYDPAVSSTKDAGLCDRIIEEGTEVGGAVVGSDDKVAVTFEVTAPTFGPGNNNYICMVDGENRRSSTDVEDFNLQPSIKVVPSSVNSGDTVNVFAQDYPVGSGSFAELKIAGQVIPNSFIRSSRSIGTDGSGEVTFEVPGGLEGILRIDAKWGSVNEDSKITIEGADLQASKTAVVPNESIIVNGVGFGSQTCIDASNVTLDNVPVMVHNDSLSDSCSGNGVLTSNSGQFVATVILWPAGSGANPTLIAGTHELSVEDGRNYSSSVNLTIAEPTITVTPDVAGPRDFITITGENWPVDNLDNTIGEQVAITVADYANGRNYSVYADSAGRFRQEHRIHRKVAIPDTVQVKATFGDVAKIASFAVPASTIEVTPTEAQPGDTLTLSTTNMPVYTKVLYVEVGGTRQTFENVNTDREGNVTVEEALVPGLDPGTYSVVIAVGERDNPTIAIGEVEVLSEGIGTGASADLPDGVSGLGDNLEAIFHFNNTSKAWTFYDPRPEFADLNTLTELVSGQPFWVLVKDNQEDVDWNGRLVDFTCAAGDCWNLEIW